jgi:hypothetical protein
MDWGARACRSYDRAVALERSSLRGTRTVLVIDEGSHDAPPWIEQLSGVYAVTTIASLVGARVAIDGRDIAAVVIVLSATTSSARPLAIALRRHPALERTPLFVIGPDVSMIAAELCGLADVNVISGDRAAFELSLQVGAMASRMSSRPAARRTSLRPSTPHSLRPSEPSGFGGSPVLLAHFGQECAQRARKGLALCELLSRREGELLERRRAADELRALFAATRADAAALQLRELAELLAMAEQTATRLRDELRPSIAQGEHTSQLGGQVLVPRGVSGLLSALRELAHGGEAVLRFDIELHRTRLQQALAR